MIAAWIAAALLLALTPAAAAVELRPLIDAVRAEAQPAAAMEQVRRIHETDRWFTFPKFAETTRHLADAMRKAGLENVEVVDAPADGITRFGFWTMPLAWDVRSATLEIIAPERIELVDYRKVPASIGMWSGATKPDGLTAEVVEFAPGADMRGKLVLTAKKSDALKADLARAGAAGAINAYTENPNLKDDRQWINAWGDNGWGFLQGDTPLLSFSITPRQAERVRALLASGRKVTARAVVDARHYAGTYPYVTGVIRGSDEGEEVLTLGHIAEQGAHDNATGIAAMLESMAALQRLIAAGKLPRPKRTIRMLAMGELYGTSHYIAKNPERIRRTAAALCYDTPAGPYEAAGTEYTFYLNPHAGKSFVDAFVLRLAREYFALVKRHFHEHAYITGTDNFLGEPMIGVPTAWPYSGTGVHTHHNSADTPGTVDQRSLRDLVVFNAAFVYYLAAAGEREAEWLGRVTLARSLAQVLAAASGELERGGNAERVLYMGETEKRAIESLRRIAPRYDVRPLVDELEAFTAAQSKRLPATRAPGKPGGRVIVRRKSFGTIPLDEIPEEKREGYPSAAWSLVPVTALYWADGTRTLDEIARLTRLETGDSKFDIAGFFRFLEKHGYVELTPSSAVR